MKKIVSLVLALLLAVSLCACTEASQVNHNINQAADNFNVTRRLEVINAWTDTPLFELIGNFSLSNNSENELVVTVELENGTYKKALCVSERIHHVCCRGFERFRCFPLSL